LQDVKLRRGPDLVIGKIRLKLRKTRRKSNRKVFDIRKLKCRRHREDSVWRYRIDLKC
jgi:hypothetical protein